MQYHASKNNIVRYAWKPEDIACVIIETLKKVKTQTNILN